MAKRFRIRRKSPVSFDVYSIVEKELADKIKLWILRILFKLDGHKKFIDKNNYFDRDYIAYFLGVGNFTEMEEDEFSRAEVINQLLNEYLKLEKKKSFSTNKILGKNLNQLSKLMNLNKFEKQILEFAILLTQYEILDDSVRFIGDNLNSTKVKKSISIILNIPLEEVNKAFLPNSKLSTSAILTIDKRGTTDLLRKLEPISEEFFDDMLNQDIDILQMLKKYIRPCKYSILSLKDYSHIQKDLDILIPYLKNAIKSKQKGVNILLYGPPGTGKTELAKLISKTLKIELLQLIISVDVIK